MENLKLRKYVLSSSLCLALVTGSVASVNATPSISEAKVDRLNETQNPMTVSKSSGAPIGVAEPLADSQFRIMSPVNEKEIYSFTFTGVTYSGLQSKTFSSTGKNIQINSQADADNYNYASGDYYIELWKKRWFGSDTKGKLKYPFGTQTVYVGKWSDVGDGDFFFTVWVDSDLPQKIDGAGKVYQNDGW